MDLITAITYEVTDRHGRFMGFEFEIAGETYFYAANQWLWPGLSVGGFPNDADGRRFTRTMLHNVTRSPAPATNRDHAEPYELITVFN